MAGYNMLEALSCEVRVDPKDVKDSDIIGSIIQDMEKVLVKPGWTSLRQVSFKVSCIVTEESDYTRMFSELLQYLPDKYLSHPLKLSRSLLLSIIQLPYYHVTLLLNIHFLCLSICPFRLFYF